jgi:hypothetical protein
MKRPRTFLRVNAPPLADPKRARLFAIIARDARRAVVFRRGPTRKTRLILWNLRDDTLEGGQWFFGRIYERRCDLSPDGKLLSYFAAKFVKPYGTWTAISRPPYFTALAFWPKGDSWGGGALFEDERTLLLNHREGEREVVAPQGPPKAHGLSVKPFGVRSGGGEDHPIYPARLTRDGWSVEPHGQAKEQSFDAPVWIVFDPPHVRSKQLTGGGTQRRFTLRVLTHGYHEKDGRSWVETADVLDHEGTLLRDFGRIDWIDTDHNGDILLAREGKLERLRRGDIKAGNPKVVADLHDMAFEPLEAPNWAQTWPKRRPSKR